MRKKEAQVCANVQDEKREASREAGGLSATAVVKRPHAPDASYGIGEVEEILGVKAHVIRYWEKEIPLIQPEKNKYNGRMRYFQKDIQLLLRLKYLLYDKKFTVEGAREQLYRELSGESGGDQRGRELRAEIALLRSDLLDIYFINKRRSCAGFPAR
jgi:DNA-binding transcriptional MerR regulator